jgi:hypothetical protein
MEETEAALGFRALEERGTIDAQELAESPEPALDPTVHQDGRVVESGGGEIDDQPQKPHPLREGVLGSPTSRPFNQDLEHQRRLEEENRREPEELPAVSLQYGSLVVPDDGARG